jgi:hypothetical protein
MAGQSGTGVVTFGGVDLTSNPYYAHLTSDAKYWFLDGQSSQQFITSTQSLVSSMPYFQTFVLHEVFRIEPPDGTRVSMLYALTQLSSLLDPSKGEQKLVFAEYPAAYFIAKKQTSALQNETAIPYMVEMTVEFACTGPAYSTTENVATIDIVDTPTEFTLTSNGDALASPRWRYTMPAAWGYTGNVEWANNTTGESVAWDGALSKSALLDVIMDEYGIPRSVLVNGTPTMATVTGPAWPHLVPGDNDITFTGPSAGTLEIRWRDRFMVGAQ